VDATGKAEISATVAIAGGTGRFAGAKGIGTLIGSEQVQTVNSQTFTGQGQVQLNATLAF
jgi:hypothetical protein